MGQRWRRGNEPHRYRLKYVCKRAEEQYRGEALDGALIARKVADD